MAFTPAPKMKVALPPTDNEIVTGRTTVLYGDSTAGKTTNLFEAALYLHSKYNKPIRLISAEDSTKTVMLPLFRLGIVDGLFITRVDDPVSVMRSLASGAWNNENPYCGYFIEGLTSIAGLIQEYNREHKLFLGEQAATSHTTAGGETLSLPGQFSYNFVQMEMGRYLRQFSMLPGIERVIWTAHESKGTADGPVTGPGTTGLKGTTLVMRDCGNLLHLDVTSKAGKVTRKLYFESHPDPTTPVITSLAKITLPLAARHSFCKSLGIKSVQEPIELTLNADNTLDRSLATFLKAEDDAMDELVTSYLTSKR